jgi:hypothetical protein
MTHNDPWCDDCNRQYDECICTELYLSKLIDNLAASLTARHLDDYEMFEERYGKEALKSFGGMIPLVENFIINRKMIKKVILKGTK